MSEDTIQSLALELAASRVAAEPEQTEKEPEGQAEQAPTEEPEQVEDQSEEVESTEEFIEFAADGATHKATLDELKKLAAGGLNYTRKMQELPERAKAEAEKIVQERTKALESERASLLEKIATAESFYNQPFVTDAQLDQLIQDGDTETYLKVTRQEEQRKRILATLQADRQKVLDAKAKEEQEQFKQAAINHTQQLFEKMPELKDPAAQTKLAAYLKSNGLSEQEISNFIDHRGLIIAEKARRFDELSGGKLEPVRKDPPKVIKKVGATINKQTYTQRDLEESKARFEKSGDLRDAANLLLKMRQTGV